jgi:hypothetical protein
MSGQINKPDRRGRRAGDVWRSGHRNPAVPRVPPLKSNEDFQDEESSDEDPKGFVLAVIRNAAEKVKIAIRNLSPDFEGRIPL